MKTILVLAIFVGLGIAGWWFLFPGSLRVAAETVGVAERHDHLGWLDNAELTQADFDRARAVSGFGQGDNLSVIRSIQAGVRGSVTAHDFELLRQDRRRAQAAYPDVKPDDLFVGTWLSVDVSARVPDKFCTSGNSNGTEIGGKWYLDGGCHVSVVKPQYTQRADVATTARVLAAVRDQKHQKRASSLGRWGYFGSWSGTGGSASIHCYHDPLPSNEEADDRHVAGQCVIVIDDNEKLTFPFVVADWLDPPWTKEGLRKLAADKGAVAEAYTPAPEKPWVMRNGSLARGQTCPPGRLCRSMWNADRDDYDNTDIGPADPASWTLESFLGMPLGYVPSIDNGERRADPGKPWFLVASFYGYPDQVSGGWDEAECKAAMTKFGTGMTYPMDGRDFASVNRGNLREVRATQLQPPNAGIQTLADRTLPVVPSRTPAILTTSPIRRR